MLRKNFKKILELKKLKHETIEISANMKVLRAGLARTN